MEGLALGECIHLSDAAVLEIATYKPHIKYLDLNGCKKITDNSLRSLSSICTKLEYLNIKATNITDTGLITLSNSKAIELIQELNLSYLPVSEHVLIKLIKNATSIKTIQLYGCYNIKKIDDIKRMIEHNNKNIVINI